MLLALIEIVGADGPLAGAVPGPVAPAWTVATLMLGAAMVVMGIVVASHGLWRWHASADTPAPPAAVLPIAAPAPRIELGDQVRRLLAHVERANTSFDAAIAAHRQAGDCLDSAEYQLRCLREELTAMTAGRARTAARTARPGRPSVVAPVQHAALLAA